MIRKVTDEDVARLTEIKIKRISRFDSFKADEKIRGLEEEIDKVQFNLDNLVDFAIDYFKGLKKEFAEGRERKTEIKTFDTIDRTKVAVANAKLYVQKDEGFIGTGLKRGEGEFVCDCSDIDDVIVFRKDGTMIVTKVSGKAFVGKNIIHVWVWKKGDKRRVYNAIYRDGKLGKTYVKRFSVTSITRDKEYAITKGSPGSEVLYFTANPNGEAEVVSIILKQQQRVKKLKFDFDFSEQAIKGRGAAGNTLSKYPVRKVELKEAGVSTLGARKIWFDETVSRLNAEERGRFLGAFQPQDKILVLLDSGEYKLIGFDLSNRFEENMIHIEKWVPKKPVSVVYYDGGKEDFFVKRFLVEPSKGKVSFISDSENSKLWVASTLHHPYASIKFNKRFKHTRDKEDQLVNLRDFIAVKGLKAQGNKLSALPITEVHLAPANEELEAIAEEQLLGKPKKEPKEVAESPVESGSETTTGTPDEVSPTIDLELPSSSPSDNEKDDTSDENPLTLF